MRNNWELTLLVCVSVVWLQANVTDYEAVIAADEGNTSDTLCTFLFMISAQVFTPLPFHSVTSFPLYILGFRSLKENIFQLYIIHLRQAYSSFCSLIILNSWKVKSFFFISLSLRTASKQHEQTYLCSITLNGLHYCSLWVHIHHWHPLHFSIILQPHHKVSVMPTDLFFIYIYIYIYITK